jgi:hypothetical protein
MIMKRLVAFAAMMLISGATFAETYTAPVVARRVPGPPKPAPPLPAREPGGVIPRAARSGHPLQMLNPFAPPRYGTSQQSVALKPEHPGQTNGKPEDPGKWNGIKLFEFYF